MRCSLASITWNIYASPRLARRHCTCRRHDYRRHACQRPLPHRVIQPRHPTCRNSLVPRATLLGNPVRAGGQIPPMAVSSPSSLCATTCRRRIPGIGTRLNYTHCWNGRTSPFLAIKSSKSLRFVSLTIRRTRHFSALISRLVRLISPTACVSSASITSMHSKTIMRSTSCQPRTKISPIANKPECFLSQRRVGQMCSSASKSMPMSIASSDAIRPSVLAGIGAESGDSSTRGSRPAPNKA